MTAHGVTRKEYDVLVFVDAYIEEHKASPSYDEIADALGLRSKSGVSRMVTALAERGHVTHIPRRNRSLAVVEESRLVRSIRSARQKVFAGHDEAVLPWQLVARLAAHCARTGDKIADVIEDAVKLHLDHAESELENGEGIACHPDH